MDKPLISIVIPVYNVEEYLERCIYSIQHQTYQNLEIILVDDGATDQSGEICDMLAKKDARIQVIHKENGGLSSARNAGIKAASGEYVSFVDSDDTVELDMVEYLYKLIQKFHTNMSLCSHTVIFGQDKKLVLGNQQEECLSAERCIEKMLYHLDVDTSAWAKLYRKAIFDEIEYPVGKLFEDIGTTYKTFIKSGKIACGYFSKYNYFVRSTSIVRKEFSPRKFDLIEMTDSMGAEVIKRFPFLRNAVLRRQVYARFSTLNQMEGVTAFQDEKSELIRFINTHRRAVLLDWTAPFRDKIAIICLAIGESFYYSAWNMVKP